MPTVILAEPEPISAQRLLSAAQGSGHEVRVVDDLEAALEQAEALLAEVLVVGPSLVGDLACELCAYLHAAGRTATVFAATEPDAATLKAALRAGAVDVVGISDDLSEIAAAIDRAGQRSVPSASGAAAGASETPSGRVVTVFSTKGGVGKTVLATNLGASLARMGKRVVLVDLDLEFGDVGIMLGLKPQRTIHDAVLAFDRLDSTMLEGYLEEHGSGLKVMLAPVRPEDAEAISSSRVTHLLNLLRASFDYVIVDTSPSFSDVVLAALDRSDAIYVVTMMDVASIKNTRISLQKLKQLGLDNGRVWLVLNRADSKVLLEPGEVEAAITGEVVAHIPSDRVVPRSVNKGVPVVIDAPKTTVARALLKLAEHATTTQREAADVA